MLELSADPASPLYRDELDPHRRVIVYCASGNRSALSADTLRRMGYENVAHIDGGMMAWKQAGHPAEEIRFG
jgi:rhodanese-related sulfurtransferase